MNPQVAFANLDGGTDACRRSCRSTGRCARPVRPQSDGTADGGVHALFTINGRPGSRDGVRDEAARLRDPGGERNVIFRIPTPIFGAGLMERSRTRRFSPARRAPRRRRARSAFAAGRTSPSPGGRSRARPTTTATTARSPASGGRRRTNRCCCSRARPTTSRWGSPTSCSRPSATRTRPASTRHAEQHHRNRGDERRWTR